MVEPKKFDFCDYNRNKCFSSIFSDVIIKIGNEEIFAHKYILARNEVFNNMFNSNLLESKSNTVEIKDCEVKTFKTFLKYLYTCEVADDEKTVHLLALADKYLENDLKLLCEPQLYEDINVENSISKLSTAIKYRCDVLKEKTSEFVVKHYDEVQNNQDFKSMLSDSEK